MKRYYFVLILLLTINIAHGQTGFKPGFIITHENDTISGLINNRGYIKNSISCLFRKNSTSEIVEYFPFEIKAYRFIGDMFYVSKEITFDNEKRKVFAEFLVDGLVNLYFYRDIINDRYYIEKDGDYFIELNDDKDELLDKGIIYESPGKKYIISLRSAFRDCPQIQPELGEAEINHKSLSRIVEQYQKYTCDDECIVYQKNIPPPKLSFGLGLGLSNSVLLCVKADGLSKIAQNPQISGFLNVTTPLTNERLSIQFELVYDNIYIGKSFFNRKNFYSDISLKYQTISFPILLKYKFTMRKISPFFGCGVEYIRLFGSRVVGSTKIQYDNYIEPAYHNTLHLKSEFPGILLDFGAEYKINKKQFISIKTRYNRYANISNDSFDFRYRVHSFTISLGLSF